MFRHKGKSRNFKHNLGLAAILSFVAGIVNVAGFLAVQRLTTNVTGHFAFMVEAIKVDWHLSLFYALYIICFFLGSFISNFIVEMMNGFAPRISFQIPVFIEASILISVAFLPYSFVIVHENLIACILLFSMGFQNSLVTTISNSVVRTTHLTGLFTDLGIELSQLFFFKSKVQHQKLFSSIKLRFVIITSFFIGGLIAGVLFPIFKMRTLTLASVTLLCGLFIDFAIMEIRYVKIVRKRI
ncbi:MAG: DUF1275 domain-containing protein [Bacteroidetes bacterium]|nr:DUF1275 domain-containing protein [Bacteroidota bacterium]MBS1739896.1 DUF1275 domain-containing protein [Bacteroidota bacterium]MBS1777543.1 DUF1275 domain-containing protein [Bacteroidota bacterium]